MSPWFPDSQMMTSPAMSHVSGQAGLALVVSLVLLLVLTAMGMGLAYVASVQSDLVAAVANKPLSIDASETCFDNAVEWLAKPAGQSWVNGLGAPMDLAASGGPLNGKTVLGDTIPEHLRYAGELRLKHKQASLDELGHLSNPPMTKDAIAGRIRRLLAMADKRAEELGIPATDADLPEDLED